MIRRAYRVWLRYLQPERNFRRLSRTAAWGHGRSMLRKAGGPARAVFTGWLLGNALIWDLKLPGSISHWYYYNERWLGGHPDAGRVYAPRFATEMGIWRIRRRLGNDAVSTDLEDLEAHGFSEWSTSNARARPEAVVRPTSTEDVCEVVKICYFYKIPIIPFGAGSSVEGNFSAPYRGVCVDLSRMNAIVDFHPDDMDVVVQAGVNWTELNEKIRDSGLFLPLDPSPTALIGGMIATNCSGTNALKYGTMKDYVLNITAVLADGRVIKTRRRPRKSSAGYNLNALFAGSEGTLGIITEATLKLAVIPPKESVATVTFATVREAAAAAGAMVRKGINLAALELMDGVQMNVVNRSGGAGGKDWAEEPTLFLKFSGTDQAMKDSIREAKEVARSSACRSFESATSEEEMTSLWSARKQALWACLAVRPEGTVIWSTDAAVPISRMADIIEECTNDASKLGLFSSVLGHVGDGNFHQMIMYNPNNPDEAAAVKKVVDDTMTQALEMGGTVSGEHGIGLGKKHGLLEELGPDTIEVMKRFKHSVDPFWLMNPGKIFDEGERVGRRL